GAAEVCNGQDDDCDGATDDNVTGVGDPCDGPDADHCADGFTVCTGAGVACDETGPGRVEACNGVDDTCDGVTDEGCDGDPDGYCGGDGCDPSAPACPNGCGDCNDADASVHPGATETCNRVDDDCDDVTDDVTPVASHCGRGACARDGTVTCVDGELQDSCK